MKNFNVMGTKVLACAAAAAVLTAVLSWSFVESTAVVHGTGAGPDSQTVSVAGMTHGGAPLAPFGAAVLKRSATLVG